MVMAPLIAAGAVASIAVAPAVTTGVVIASVLQALAGLAGNIAANDLHTYFSEPLRDDFLQSKDLARAIMDAISLVIDQASTEIDKPERAAVKQLSATDLSVWMEAQATIAQSDEVTQISSEEVLQFFSTPIEGFARFQILNIQSWQEIVHGLAAAHSISIEGEIFSSGSKVAISRSTVALLSERLHNTFPRALFEVLKSDFANGGKAYGELLMRMLGGITARQIETFEIATYILQQTTEALERGERIEDKVDKVLNRLAVTDSTDQEIQDYLRALSIFASTSPYLALEQILGGEKRELKDIYVPLRTRLLKVSGERSASDELNEGITQGDLSLNQPSDKRSVRSSDKLILPKNAVPAWSTLPDVFAAANGNGNQESIHVLLQGLVGTGKSTALRHIAAYAFSEPQLLGLPGRHLPIVVRLQVLADVGGASLEERLLNSLRRAGDLVLEQTPGEGFLRRWSDHLSSPWILLLDGLDEVVIQKREETLRWVSGVLRMLGARHPVVLTSRPAIDPAYRSLWRHLTVAELLPFDEIQKRDFAIRWFSDGAEEFLAAVDQFSKGNWFTEPMVMTPLLLTVAATVYRKYGDLSPAGQVELYGKFIDILLEEAGRHGLWNELGDEVSDFARSALEELALSMSLDPQVNTLATLVDVCASFLSSQLGWNALRAQMRGKQLLEVLSKRSGVFYEQGEIFQWLHPTFREYLAAQALERRLRESANDYESVISEKIQDEKWTSVLITVSLTHQKPAALIRWMSRRALDRFDSRAALLAHKCWQDSQESLREVLRPDIINGLAGGLGDLQSGLAVEARLREHLINFGDVATNKIVELIYDFNGLQQRLLPEWKGNRHPDVNTEAGHRIYSGYKARYNLIDVLGDIGSSESIDPLISWLNEQEVVDSYRRDIAHHARKALKCIGLPAVDPLLKRIGDVNLGIEARIDNLNALNVVGIRTASVSPVIESCLTEGLQGNAKLLASSLRTATCLRDCKHSAAAMLALNSQEREVVTEAANYFIQMPDVSTTGVLHNVFAKWCSMADGSFNSNWMLKRLVVAIGALGTARSMEIVSTLIDSGLSEQNELSDADAIELANTVRLPNFATLLLQELARKINVGTPGRVLDRVVTQIGERWRPHETIQLAHCVESMLPPVESRSFATRLLDIYLRDETENSTEDQAYRNLDGQPILRLMAKCEVSDFGQQAVRLLPRAEFWLVSQVADALWLVGDTSVEDALIQALDDFERPSMQKDRPMPEEFDILRALGTCACKRGVDAVINYVKANPDLSIYVPEEVFCPLVRRGVLDVNKLAEMAVNSDGIHGYVRRASILALGYLDAETFAPVFLKSLGSESDELTKGHAAFFLGWAKTDRESAVKSLRDLLTRSDKPYLAEQAAESLVRLDDRESLRLIENTIERFGTADSTSGLLQAVARFHAPSTLQLLERIYADKRSGGYFQTESEMIAAFGEFYDQAPSARAVVDAVLDNSSHGIAVRTQQTAVSVLALHNPNALLQRATTLYDEGLLHPNACGTLINRIPQISKSKDIITGLLIDILKRFLCDQSLSMREATASSLQFIDAALTTELYNQLNQTGNEWARTCAIYSLGFWDSDDQVIQSARFDSSPLVRRSASIASMERAKRSDLRAVSQSFRNDHGVARLSAYYSLIANASEAALSVLRREIKEGDPARLYMRELREGIDKRVRDERQKRIKEEEEQICETRRYISFAP